jgi:beta-lactamase class A
MALMAVSAAAGAPAKENAELARRIAAALAQANGTFGVSVKHVEQGETVSIRGDERFQMASVFKIPVLVELFTQVQAGKVSLDERVEWTNPEHYFGSGILVTLSPGIKPTIRDLATLMIIVSDNAATDLLVGRLGPANVTARMQALGLTQTRVDGGTRDLILRAIGLSDPKYRDLTTASLGAIDWQAIAPEVRRSQEQFLKDCPNCATPDEMTRLVELIFTGKAAGPAQTTEMLTTLSRQQFNARLPRFLPLGTRVDHKTGTLNGPVWVVNDAGLIYLPNKQHVIVSVFSRGGELDQDEAAMKLGINQAEERIGEIAKIVYDYYTATASAAAGAAAVAGR